MMNEDLRRMIDSYTNRPEARELVKTAPNLMRILAKNGDLETIARVISGRKTAEDFVDGRYADTYVALSSGADDYANYFAKETYRYYDWEGSGKLLDPDVPNAYENEKGYVDMEGEVDAFNGVMERYGLQLGWYIRSFEADDEDDLELLKTYGQGDFLLDNYEDSYPRPQKKEEDDEEEEEEEEEDDGGSKFGDHDLTIGFFGLRQIKSGVSAENRKKGVDVMVEVNAVAETTYPQEIRRREEVEQMTREDEASALLRAYTGEHKEDDDQPPPLEQDV